MIKCCDVLEGLKQLEDNSVDCVIADPPYSSSGHNFGNNIDKIPLKDYVAWSMDWIDECERVMKPSATMFIYGFPEIICHIAVNMTMEFKFLQFHYTNKAIPSLKSFWQRSHESILTCWLDKNERIFNLDESRIKYSSGFLKGSANKSRKPTLGRFSKGDKESVYKVHPKGALPRDLIEINEDNIPDVISVPALAGGAGMVERMFLCKTCDQIYPNKEFKNHSNHETIKHPTQKPMELTRRLITSCKPKEGGKVLILFAGSGSEALVCKIMKLDFLGFEINPDYVKLAQRTIDYYEKNNTIL